MPDILAFCRFTLGLAFLMAFTGKVRDVQSFRHTIIGFRLLPAKLSTATALLILSSELGIITCMMLGSAFLLPGFLLALALLLVFSGALASVIVRKQRLSCNCFGASSQLVTPVDLWRNAGLGLCAVGGCGAQSWSSQAQPLGLMEWLLVALVATIFVLLWTQLSSLVQLFR